MKEAERAIGRAERRRDELTEALAEGTADHTAMAAMGAELAAVEARLAATEDEWLALAEESER